MKMKNEITSIKICGLTTVENALAVAGLGVDAIGLVFYAESPRCVTNKVAQEIVNELPPFVSKVGLFVNPSREDVLETLELVDLNLLQFHGDEKPDFCGSFSKPYLKAISVTEGMDLVEYCRTFGEASGLLLDTFSDGARGGTGKVFNWGLVPKQLDLPIVLAGGLSPGNVSEAIDSVSHWAVDVSSGVENGQKGVKDLALVQDFINEVKNADARKFRKL